MIPAIRSRFKSIVLAVILALMVLSPALFLYKSMRNYISPTRGQSLTQNDLVKNQKKVQLSVNAPLSAYKLFLNKETSYRMNIHHGFYFGILTLLLIPLGIFYWRNKYFIALAISCIATIFLGLGNNFIGYNLLTKYIPTFNMMRHSYVFAQFATFLFICLCGFGLKVLLADNQPKTQKIFSIVIISLALIKLLTLSKRPEISVMLILISAFIIITIFSRTKQQPILFILLVFMLLGDLIPFYNKYNLLCFHDFNNYPPKVITNNHDIVLKNTNSVLKSKPLEPARFTYPRQRHFYSSIPYPIPFDISPLIYKEAVLTHKNDDYIFLRNKFFDKVLSVFNNNSLKSKSLGIESELIYFTANAKVLNNEINENDFIDKIFSDNSQHNTVVFSKKDIDFKMDNANQNYQQPIDITYLKTNNPNNLEISLNTSTNGFLVRLENYDPFWQSFIDGKKVKTYKANFAFQAIKVPPGKHTIDFKFISPYPIFLYLHLFGVFIIWLWFMIWIKSLDTTSIKNNSKTI